jgi:hypothetical protein
MALCEWAGTKSRQRNFAGSHARIQIRPLSAYMYMRARARTTRGRGPAISRDILACCPDRRACSTQIDSTSLLVHGGKSIVKIDSQSSITGRRTSMSVFTDDLDIHIACGELSDGKAILDEWLCRSRIACWFTHFRTSPRLILDTIRTAILNESQ